MKTAKVIVGSNFGDEGKGHLTDYFASEYGKDCIVVRYNGGAQAGHTVVTPEGERHVFHHFGSGTLTGAKTYLSQFFVVNPILFKVEWDELQTKGIKPVVFADPRCLVTTPYDMVINQMIEEHREDKKHGSCGLGFNETIERSKNLAFKIEVKDLLDRMKILNILKSVILNYMPQRLAQLGMSQKIPDSYMEILSSNIMIENYFNDLMFFMNHVQRVDEVLLLVEDNIIFEGAQGLLLDQDYSQYFPYLTRSKTGIDNVLHLIKDTGIEHLDITYVTRPYATRHGAGPMTSELSMLPKHFRNVKDETNIYNTFQGGLRFGYLDVNLLRDVIQDDLAKVYGLSHQHSIAITCMDQMEEKVTFINNEIMDKTKKGFIDYLTNELGPHTLYTGTGPTRNDILKNSPWE